MFPIAWDSTGRMAAKGKVGPHLWAITDPATNQMQATRCLLCKDIIYEAGSEVYVPAAFIKGVRLHFLLAHDVDATDLPEVP